MIQLFNRNKIFFFIFFLWRKGFRYLSIEIFVAQRYIFAQIYFLLNRCPHFRDLKNEIPDDLLLYSINAEKVLLP